MTRSFSQFSKLSCFLGLILASLISSNAWASATEGKPNPNCPQFAPGGFPFPTEAKVVKRAWHICHTAYSAYFDPTTRGPLWSAELLDGANLDSEEPRTNDFRPDPDLPASIQARGQKDFVSPIREPSHRYDRGHLSPAGDFKALGPQVMSESFYYSNMVPQNSHNNQNAWQKLEIFTRQWAQARGKVYVVTGPIFSAGKALEILPSGLAVPTHMFKVVVDYARMQSIAFVVPNRPIMPDGVDSDTSRRITLKQWEGELSKYTVSIRDVEAWSGLRFDSGLDAARRDALHAKSDGMWSTRKPRQTN